MPTKTPAKAEGTTKTAPKRTRTRTKPTEAEKAEASTVFAPSFTVKQLEAMSKEELSKAGMDERAAARRAKDAGVENFPTPVNDWIADPANASKKEAKAKKATTRRANFAVIPYPKGQTAYNLDSQTHKCVGEPAPSGVKGHHKPGAVLPIRKFPTTTPDKRTEECRGCRDFRQEREARAAKGEAYVVKPKAETPAAPAKDTAKRATSTKKAEGTKKAAPKATTKATSKASDAPVSPVTPPKGTTEHQPSSEAQEAVKEAVKAARPPKRSTRAKTEVAA